MILLPSQRQSNPICKDGYPAVCSAFLKSAIKSAMEPITFPLTMNAKYFNIATVVGGQIIQKK